jgi:cobalt-zinc-cadmium efflux system membrane fusion protein
MAVPAGCDRDAPSVDAESAAEDVATGPRGGRLLFAGDLTLELAIFEAGVPPEYRAWAAIDGRAVDPAELELTVELTRLGGIVDRIGFAPAADYLRGDREIYEPHSFDVRVSAAYAGRSHEWSFESHEGRTTIPADVAQSAGIAVASAGPGPIVETLTLYGAIAADPARIRHVKARFPGVIRDVRVGIGDVVRAGAALATVEANESLQAYTVAAPIAGVITERHAEGGEQAGDDVLFEIADFSSVWAELGVFPRDGPRLRVGQPVRIAAEGGIEGAGQIQYLAPLGDRLSQALTARVVLDNQDGRWLPGRFVEAEVTVAEIPADLAVPLSALQTFRDFDVVFARFGDTYEVRMLELGRRDAERVEVLGGLTPGTEYVTENSYLVKADIEKSGASHDH